MDEIIYGNLVEKIRNNEVILWVGAGFSKYAGLPLGSQLVEMVKNDMSEKERELINHINLLPDLAEEYVQIKSRVDLIRLLKRNIDINIDFNKLTAHQAILRIPQIKNIITTNYDCLFEKVFEENIEVIAKDSDVAFISDEKINLFKIHGDFNNKENMIITRSDYTDFFNGKINSLLWNELKSLMAKKSILFVGYGFGDQNVDAIFKDICDKLGEFKKESYLVVPGLDQYKIKRLSKNDIRYLDITGEVLFELLEQDIKKKLIVDCSKGKISIKNSKIILSTHGIDVDFKICDTDIVVKAVKAGDEPLKISMNLSVNKEDSKSIEQIEKFDRAIRGESIEPVILSGKCLKDINGIIKGVDVPILNGELDSMYLVPLPEEVFTCDLLSISNDISIKCKFKRYILRDEIIIILEMDLYKLTWKFNLLAGIESNIKITTKKSQGKYEHEIKEIKVMIDWLLGKKVRLYREDNYKWSIMLPSPKNGKAKEFIRVAKLRKEILQHVIDVRRYFGVNFKKIDSINRDEYELLENLSEIGKTRKLRVDSISFSFKSNDEFIDMLKDDSIFMIGNEDSDNIDVDILGEKIKLGKHMIKCNDAYVSNYDDVKNDKTDKIIFKSKSNKLHIEYCF
ncbi:SIR2 family NAD-dependent protein deacylase [Clostridium gasigenes]|uniref:SIR2-like domain-containing protein n=1 Tax=Clostridium gasigenes TaxID=94869 RepID=A0A1H0VL14_9CLOT|nr:SIR2 family protein [Clostridium gasigenes]SDP79292.1 SIR2-like domain-containing protein [Clostridium gasigenes]